MVKEIEDIKDLDAILSKNPGKLIVIDFFAQWCGPCKRIAPTFAKYAEEYPNAIFVKVDNDREDVGEDLTERHKVEAFPTFVLMKDGKEVGRIVGANEDDLKNLIDANYK